MEINISKNKILELNISFLIFIYIMLALFFELQIPGTEFVSIPIILFSGILIISFSFNKVFKKQIDYKISKNTLLICFLFLFILINSFFVREKIQFGAIFNLLLGAVIGKYLATSKNSSYFILLPFWILVIYIIMQLLNDPNPNNVFIRSRNYISFFLILTILPYYFTRINLKKQVSFFPSLITLVLSVYCLGRSGIISSLLIFLAILYYSKLDGLYIKFFGFIILCLVIYFFNIFLKDISIIDIERLINFANYGELGGRSTIIKNYIDNSNLFSLLFGMDTNRYEILALGGDSYVPGHVHSSILNLISVTGIASLYFFKEVYYKIIIFIKSNPTISILLIALLLRISTETGLLFGYFDYTFWMFMYSKKY